MNRDLSAAEKELLVSAANNGIFIVQETDSGDFVMTYDRQFGDRDDAAVAVKYLEALDHLKARDLVSSNNRLTSRGFEVARQFAAEQKSL